MTTVSNFLYQPLKKAQIILCLFFSCHVAWSANEFITGFHLNSCTTDFCYQLKVSDQGLAEGSPLAPLYVFGPSELRITQNDGAETVFIGQEGVLDLKHGHIILRNIREHQGKDLLFYTRNGQIRFY
jgi:hypothetical protein